MRCPHCSTENRDDRATCYHCGKDLAMLRLIVNRAKQHFNNAVEMAEQQRYLEALGELNSALELDSRLEQALVLRGSILARIERFDEAREAWDAAIALNPQALRAHRYLLQAEEGQCAPPLIRRLRIVMSIAAVVTILSLAGMSVAWLTRGDAAARAFRDGMTALQAEDFAAAHLVALNIRDDETRSALLTAVSGQFEDVLANATATAREGNQIGAARILARLDTGELPPDLDESLRRARRELLDSLRAQLMQTMDDTGFSIEEARLLRQDARAVADILRTSEVAPWWRELEDEWRGRLIARAAEEAESARTLMAEEAVPHRASHRLHRASVYTALLDIDGQPATETEEMGRLRRELDALAERAGEILLAAADTAAQTGDREEFERIMASIDSLAAILPSLPDRAGALRETFGRIETQRLVAELRGALRERQFQRIETIERALRASDYSFGEEMEAHLEQARRDRAIQSYYALIERAPRIESGDIDSADAREILEAVSWARGLLPPRLQARAAENLAFFAAQAHRLLGNEPAMEREVARLRDEFPDSPYLSLIDSPLPQSP